MRPWWWLKLGRKWGKIQPTENDSSRTMERGDKKTSSRDSKTSRFSVKSLWTIYFHYCRCSLDFEVTSYMFGWRYREKMTYRYEPQHFWAWVEGITAPEVVMTGKYKHDIMTEAVQILPKSWEDSHNQKLRCFILHRNWIFMWRIKNIYLQLQYRQRIILIRSVDYWVYNQD